MVLVLLSGSDSGVDLSADGRGVIVRQEGAAPLRVAADSEVVATGAGGAVRFRSAELVPDHTPDGPPARLRDWYGRQEALAVLARAGPVRLHFMAEGGRTVLVTPERGPRRPARLVADVWLLLVEAVAVGLLGAWILVLKPRDPAARMFAAACAGVVATGLSGALYDGRDLLHGGMWLWPVQALNLVGTWFCSAALIALYLLLPRRLVGAGLAWALVAASGVGAAAVGAGLAPLSVWYGGLLATVAAYLVLVAVQWRLAHGRPEDRAVLQYLGATTTAGMGLLSGFMAVPVLFGGPALLGDGSAALPVAVVFGGTALGVRRRRLFELEAWSHRIMRGVLLALVVLLSDAVLVWGLSLTAPAASAASLVVIGLVYLPLRGRLQDRVAGRSRPSGVALFQAATTVAFTSDAAERSRRWRELLASIYEPLEIRTLAESTSDPSLGDDGVELHLPATPAGPALALAHRSGGRRLFGEPDLALAGELTGLLRQAEATRAEYLRGVTEERRRIAQDLHDDINARLLTSLHRSDLTHVRSDVRQAMSDIRTLLGGLSGEGAAVGRLLADLRFESAERLSAAGITLTWPAQPDDLRRLEPMASRTLVAGVREAVSNVVRHSGARAVHVETGIAPDWLELTLTDDGVGLGCAPARGDGGAVNLQERARRAGGRAVIADASPGVLVRLVLPVRPPDEPRGVTDA